jgi:segregation and condensation protein B
MIEDLTNKIEALLFSAARLFTIEEIEEIVGIRDKEAIKNAIKELQERHKETSLIVVEERGGYRFTIKEPYMPIVSKVVEDTELNKSVMETLAVIAWKAPVIQSEIIKIRSNKAYDHIGELKEAGFIVKEKDGRSYKIKLAPKFYEYFDIRNKEDIKEKFSEVEKKAEEKQMQKIEEMAQKQQKKDEKTVEESLEEIRESVKKSKIEQEKLRKKQEKDMEEKEIEKALESDEDGSEKEDKQEETSETENTENQEDIEEKPKEQDEEAEQPEEIKETPKEKEPVEDKAEEQLEEIETKEEPEDQEKDNSEKDKKDNTSK